MTTVRDIETFLYAWAPRETAESWWAGGTGRSAGCWQPWT